MAEILVKAVAASNSNPAKDAFCYKRGMCVIIMPDGHPWGLEERLPKFAVIKVPLVSIAKVQKYIAVWPTVQRRRWRIRWADLPLAARNKLQDDGELTIKAKSEYLGAFDYTWNQVKEYFHNDETNLDETEDIGAV